MAFAPEQDPNQQQPGSPTAQPGPLAQQAPISTVSAPGAPAAGHPNAPTPAAPTQPFANLATYLSANAPQIEAQGQKIAGDLAAQYGKISGDIGAAGAGFQGQVAGGYTPANPDLVSRVAANPVAEAANPADVAAFRAQATDQYKGPTNMDIGPVQGEVAAGVNTASALGAPGGVQSYLMQNAPAGYTPGMGTLDTTLLSASPQAFEPVMAQAAKFPALNDYLASTQNAAQTAVQKAQAEAPTAATAANAALATPEQTLTTGLQGELSNAAAARDKYITDLANLQSTVNVPTTTLPQGFMTANKFDPRLISAIEDIGSYNSFNPSESIPVSQAGNYLSPITPAGPPPSLTSVATPQDVAMAQALQTLSGGGYQAPVTAPGTFAVPNLPTLQQNPMGQGLYNALTNVTPTFTQTQNPGAALQEYQQAMYNLQQYLGLPVTAPPPAPLPPTSPPPPTPGPAPTGPPFLQPPTTTPPPSGGGGGFHTF